MSRNWEKSFVFLVRRVRPVSSVVAAITASGRERLRRPNWRRNLPARRAVAPSTGIRCSRERMDSCLSSSPGRRPCHSSSSLIVEKAPLWPPFMISARKGTTPRRPQYQSINTTLSRIQAGIFQLMITFRKTGSAFLDKPVRISVVPHTKSTHGPVNNGLT